MSYDLIFLLEEPSIKNVLDQLLPQSKPQQKTNATEIPRSRSA